MRKLLLLLLLITMLPLQAAWAVAGFCAPGRGHGVHRLDVAHAGAVHRQAHASAVIDATATASPALLVGAAATGDSDDAPTQGGGGECVHATAAALLPSLAAPARPHAATHDHPRSTEPVPAQPTDRLYRPPRLLPA